MSEVEAKQSAVATRASSGARVRCSMLEAISAARFQQGLLALVSEKHSFEKRSSELQFKLSEALRAIKQEQDCKDTARSELQAADQKREEAIANVAAQRLAMNDERARHTMQLTLLKKEATVAQEKIRKQGQLIHAQELQLRSRVSECSTLRAFKESAEVLIESFQVRLEEVQSLLETVSQSELACQVPTS